MITNSESGTRIDEVAESLYRVSTPIPPSVAPGGFSFNQYLVAADEPLLFHTGPRKLFGFTSEAISRVLPVETLRYVSFAHFEADECGALNEFLASAPRAVPLCSQVAAMTSVEDVADRPPRPLGDGETLDLGGKIVRWIDAPHVPHAWENGFLFEERTKTLLCGDLFTQGGAEHEPILDTDILGPSEEMRKAFDYYALGPNTRSSLERLAELGPTTLACMHGSAWRGDGGSLLRALADRLETPDR